jgi:hypothetical protein
MWILFCFMEDPGGPPLSLPLKSGPVPPTYANYTLMGFHVIRLYIPMCKEQFSNFQ